MDGSPGFRDTMPLRPQRSPRLTAAVTLIVLLAVGAAVIGGILAAGMFQAGRDAAALQQDGSVPLKSPAAVGQDVPTSFGVAAVEGITKLSGPTAKKLAGVTHGIQNFVPPNKVQSNATVTITKLQSTPLEYSPAQFKLYATRGTKFSRSAHHFRLVRSSVAPGTLQPDASIETTLDVVSPGDGSKLWMTSNHPARAPPLASDLGRTDRTRGPQ